MSERQTGPATTLGPLTDLLDDPRVVEVMLNADGVVWVERVVRTRITVFAANAERMLRRRALGLGFLRYCGGLLVPSHTKLA
jgi:Flp pilus assembly CpaF family ATPase